MVPYYHKDKTWLFNGDAFDVMKRMKSSFVDCIVTSPPYYGQRDYGVDGQIGLESHPSEYLDKLVQVFREAYRLLKPSGSLWIVIGDTYWSGRGKSKIKTNDVMQKHRRFDRPQDKSGDGLWCVPKQQLLIPHRLAIAMQSDGWIVRNDNVWSKQCPIPDPVNDRSSKSHEYIFHFVKNKRYFYDMSAVCVPTLEGGVKPLSSVWDLKFVRNSKMHKAPFSENVVVYPILATLHPDGTILDPFCGSGTTIHVARKYKNKSFTIGIDISQSALDEAIIISNNGEGI